MLFHLLFQKQSLRSFSEKIAYFFELKLQKSMYNRLLFLICISFGSCVNGELTFNPPETTRAQIPHKRKTIFDKHKVYSDEELAWKRENEIFQVFVNEHNQIFIGGKLMELEQIKSAGKRYITNYEKSIQNYGKKKRKRGTESHFFDSK